MKRAVVALVVVLFLLAVVGLGLLFTPWGANHLLGTLAARMEDGPVPPENEVVMTPGMRITAITPNGTIIVTAGKGLMRSYTWDGATRSVDMWPRAERWYGSLGLYFPGPGYHWREHGGITRCVVEEGQQHFESTEEVLRWIAERAWLSPVYRNDGLVVGWAKVLQRKQLDVEVWQVYVRGSKPTRLPGSQDDKIRVTMPSSSRWENSSSQRGLARK